MRKDIHSDAVNKLFDAVLSLKDREECYSFFSDICTINELLSLAQRFEVGMRLLEKETYQEISKATGASTATISRVNRLLGDAADGIEMVAARINEYDLRQRQIPDAPGLCRFQANPAAAYPRRI